VNLDEPVILPSKTKVGLGGDPSKAAIGYFVNYAVMEVDLFAARGRIEEDVLDGRINWIESECVHLDVSEIEKRVGYRYSYSNSAIWYKSGRAFFSE
jgi:hypothetical protein